MKSRTSPAVLSVTVFFAAPVAALAALAALAGTGCATAGVGLDNTVPGIDDDSGVTGTDAGAKKDSGRGPLDSSTPPDDGSVAADTNVPPLDANTLPVDGNAPPVDANTPVDANVPVDANTPIDANTPKDSGVVLTGCMPGSVGGFSPTTQPSGASRGSCTSTDITTIYNDCLGPNGSAAFCNLDTGTCYSCIFTPIASPWGAVVDVGGVVSVNIGGCLAGADATQASCGKSAEAVTECEYAACNGTCPASQNMGNDYLACSNNADLSVCKSYSDAATSCEAAVPSSSLGYKCTQGTTFQALFTNVAKIMCGP